MKAVAETPDCNDGSENLATCFAIYIENPDGSLAMGLPPHLQLPAAPKSPRIKMSRSDRPLLSTMPAALREGLGSDGFGAISPINYEWHERCFCGLLLVELLVEIVYVLLLYHGARHSIQEVFEAYQVLPIQSLWLLFWIQFFCEVSYLKLYFCMGFTAVVKHKPRVYSWFSNLALVGIIVQVFFSYMNKSNLLVFAFRLSSFVYARFMRGMLDQLFLMRSDFTNV